MKKLYYLIAMALMGLTFTSCEDVPAPFGQPQNPNQQETIDPTGTGTATDPYNVAGVLKYVKDLGADVESTTDVYFTGIVTSVTEAFGTQYGSATFTVADTETSKTIFTFYRGLYLGNKKYDDATAVNVKEGDKVVICGKVVYYKGSTPETAQGKAYVVSINGTGGGGDTPTPSTETIGTKDAPLTIAQAIEKINALGDGKESDLNAYVKGKVVKVTTSAENFALYGNLNYLISEDGTENNTITVYSGDGLEGAKFTAITDLAAGDEVIVFGKLYKYVKDSKVTPEINKGNYLVSLVKGSGGGTGDETIGSKDAPISIADALTRINALADNAKSDLKAYVKGKVVKVTTNQTNFEKYGNLNYLISEDGTENNTITVYSGDGLDGAKFTAITDLAAGDEVVVFGTLYKYVKNDNVTPEIDKGNYLVKLTKASGGDTPGGGDTPSGSNLLSNGDFETWTQTDYPDNWKTSTSAGNATLSKSTDSHGGTAAVMLAGDAKNNKRLGYKEITLKAGTYSTKFYAKCAEAEKTCSVARGYASVGADNKLTYVYKVGADDKTEYISVSNASWVEINNTFTLEANTTLSIIVMNNKSGGGSLLIDDFSLTTSDGGIVE